jgi:hypothetical protein
MKAPTDARELEAMLREIDRSCRENPAEATNRRLDLVLLLMLEIRRNLKGY